MGDEAVAVQTTFPHFTLVQLHFLTSLLSVQLNIKHIPMQVSCRISSRMALVLKKALTNLFSYQHINELPW